MPTLPGTIDLGKFRVVYEAERERRSDDSDRYLLQQRRSFVSTKRWSRSNNKKLQETARQVPAPLQYFIASIGFCTFSQFKRLAVKAEVALDDLEMDLRMTYDLTGRFPIQKLLRRHAGDQLRFQDPKPIGARSDHQSYPGDRQGRPHN